MEKCPNCEKEPKYNSVKCSHCQYQYRHDDLADYDKQDIIFTITFQCKNCGREFKHGFGKGDEVYPKGIGQPNFQVDEITGNPYVATIDGRMFRPRCPTCENDQFLCVLQRTPIRER